MKLENVKINVTKNNETINIDIESVDIKASEIKELVDNNILVEQNHNNDKRKIDQNR